MALVLVLHTSSDCGCASRPPRALHAKPKRKHSPRALFHGTCRGGRGAVVVSVLLIAILSTWQPPKRESKNMMCLTAAVHDAAKGSMWPYAMSCHGIKRLCARDMRLRFPSISTPFSSSRITVCGTSHWCSPTRSMVRLTAVHGAPKGSIWPCAHDLSLKRPIPARDVRLYFGQSSSFPPCHRLWHE